MRTTLTIDDGTARKLKQLAHETGKSYKDVVNATLRRGLLAGRSGNKAKPYRLKTVDLGGVVGGHNLDKALALSDQIEDDAIASKLKLGK